MHCRSKFFGGSLTLKSKMVRENLSEEEYRIPKFTVVNGIKDEVWTILCGQYL